MGHLHLHPHDHQHSHSHPHSTSKGSLKVLLVVTATYMIAEVVGGVVSRSLALIADAGHMAIDVAAMLLGLFAAWIAHRPPSPKKTFGYYRAEILAALVNAVSLFGVAFWIIYEAWERFHRPVNIDGKTMLLISVGGLLINLFGLFLMYKERESNLNLRGVWLHLLTDTLGSASSILAAVGILLWDTGWADPLVSVALSLFILTGAWRLLSECVHVLLEGVPREVDLEEVRMAMREYPEVLEVHKLHAWTVTSGVHAVSAHVKIVNASAHRKVLEGLTQLLGDRFRIQHVTLQVEPPDYKPSSPKDLCGNGE